MKKIILGYIFISCALLGWAEPVGFLPLDDEMKQRFLTSKKKWEDLKAQHQNTYTFDLTIYGTAHNWFVRTVVVKKGKISLVTIKQYDDNGKCLSTTKQVADQIASDEKTLQDIYDFTAYHVVTKDPNKFDILFELDENEILESAGFTSKTDGKFTGFYITWIEWGEKNQAAKIDKGK